MLSRNELASALAYTPPVGTRDKNFLLAHKNLVGRQETFANGRDADFLIGSHRRSRKVCSKMKRVAVCCTADVQTEERGEMKTRRGKGLNILQGIFEK